MPKTAQRYKNLRAVIYLFFAAEKSLIKVLKLKNSVTLRKKSLSYFSILKEYAHRSFCIAQKIYGRSYLPSCAEKRTEGYGSYIALDFYNIARATLCDFCIIRENTAGERTTRSFARAATYGVPSAVTLIYRKVAVLQESVLGGKQKHTHFCILLSKRTAQA